MLRGFGYLSKLSVQRGSSLLFSLLTLDALVSFHHPVHSPFSSSTTTMMGSSKPDDYMILRPERLGVFDVLGLPFSRKKLIDHNFVECGTETALELRHVKADWVVVLVAIIQKILAVISAPMKWTGIIVEFFLNLLSLNGGFLRLIWHFITASVKLPRRDAANFRSFLAHVDGRLDLYKQTSLISYFPWMDPQSILGDFKLLDLTMMAAKVAYENEAYIKEAVEKNWKMHFVGFFNCWNKYLSEKTTQAFIFCDKPVDASLICVAFRGTEPFNAQDWSTDVDISYISMGSKMGKVHLGFMKALGLQNETDFAAGLPAAPPTTEGDKPLAYYAVRGSLSKLLVTHPNAKVLVTGHSLGAALACLFPALLVYHGQEDILGRMLGVVTHAQPRVGDATFARYMESAIAKVYCRVVYRYDIVPRVPFHHPPSLFSHFGTCLYYKNWYEGQVVSEVPNPNYFDPRFVIPVYWNAWGDLLKALFLGRTQGKDFKEGWVSILFRASGLLLPGAASHSLRHYVNGARLAKIAPKDQV